jgi:hypothetical protein
MRSMVAIFGPLLFFLGCVVLWYSIDGLHYAVTDAPSADRAGDLGSAGVATLIGLLLVLFPVRWFWIAARDARKRDRPGE